MILKNTHDFKKIEGRYINLREAEISDSEFILSLRTDEKKSRYIHQTDSDLNKQIEYMKRYKTLENEWYYIIENKYGEPLGTDSICIQNKYDVWKNNYGNHILGTGRWLMSNNANSLESIETDFLVKKIFFEDFNMEYMPMMTHKDNKNVLSLHKNYGAQIVGFCDKEQQFLLILTKENYIKNKNKFTNYIYRK